MAKNNGRVEKAKVKRMVEDWEGRKLPKNVSMKTLLDRLAQERWATEVERSEGDETMADLEISAVEVVG